MRVSTVLISIVTTTLINLSTISPLYADEEETRPVQLVLTLSGEVVTGHRTGVEAAPALGANLHLVFPQLILDTEFTVSFPTYSGHWVYHPLGHGRIRLDFHDFFVMGQGDMRESEHLHGAGKIMAGIPLIKHRLLMSAGPSLWHTHGEDSAYVMGGVAGLEIELFDHHLAFEIEGGIGRTLADTAEWSGIFGVSTRFRL